ncbi:MAG: NUDIX hydrolase [Rhodobacteraceae bacterium]|nr:NUDIX hydrolase [Paracoccaceae bacterium]
MNAFPIKQLPIRVRTHDKTDMRTQFAALCYRINGDKVQVLLVTSRRSKRWIVPKGWPGTGLTPARSAMREAWEEAGVEGRAWDMCLGLYSYTKVISPTQAMPCAVMVYPVHVRRLASDYPERNQRRRKWFSPRKASKRVGEPELQRILRDFDPRLLRAVS